MRSSVLKHIYILFAVLLGMGINTSYGQNLIQNGDFNATSAFWLTSCVNVECYGFETTYGGPSGTNHVAEIDDEACMHQDVCALPGATYVFSMDASVRTSGGPNPCTSHIKIEGLDITSTPVVTLVDMDYTRTNTVFALTPVTGIPVINVPAASGVAYLRVTLTDNTPGFLTLGMIVDNISLVMTSAPTITGGGSIVTCQHAAVPFSVGGIGPTGISYVWSFGSDATPSTSTSATPSTAWSSPGVKTVTVALGNGACFSDTLTYSVTVTPALHFNIFDTTCPHTPFSFAGMSLTTSGIYNDTLFNPTGCDTIYSLYLYVRPTIVTNFYHTMCFGDSYTFNGHVFTNTGAYTDTFLTSRGCDSVSKLNLTVNAIPAHPAVTPISYCQFDMAAPITVTGTDLTWYGPGVTPSFTTTPTVSTTTPGTTVYYITQTVLGCTSDSAILLITIKPQPAPPGLRDTAYCQFSTAAPLTATGSAVHWFPDATSTTPATSVPVPSTNLPGIFTWYATQTVNGCESNKAPLNVKIVDFPVFDVTALKHLVCQFDTLQLSYSGPATATHYYWDFVAPGDSIVSGSQTTPVIDVQFIVPGRRTIYLNVIGPEGMCTGRDTVVINVDTPAIAKVNTPQGVCLGDTVVLGLIYASLNAASYTWMIDNSPFDVSTDLSIVTRNASTGGPFQIGWNTPGLHVIQLNVVSAGGCKSKNFYDTVQVYKNPNPDFTIESRGNTLCLEDSVLFKAVEKGYEYAYLWSPSNYFNNINEPNTWGKLNEYKSNVTLTVSSPYGCKASKTMLFTPDGCCKIFMPNAFTPGPNKTNNLYRPVDEGFHRFHEFRISNRWGQTVYQSANDNMSWDGTYNGVPQDMGVYYYFLKFDCGGNTVIQKGDVTLVR